MKTQLISNQPIEKIDFIFPKLLDLFYISKTKVKFKPNANTIISNWFPNLYYKNPINLLFSNDQFLYEFLLKYPQRKKISEFKLQLKEQKKLSLFYGSLSKKQIRKYFITSNLSQGEFSKNLVSLLERRLDVILYRSQFVKNISTARQLISHKKVLVNQKIISIPSYLVNPGDIVSITKCKQLTIADSLKSNFKSKNFLASNSETPLKDWKFKNKFVSKRKIETLACFLIKKIQSRSEIQNLNNPFDLNKKNYLHFHVFKFQNGQKDQKINFDDSKKLIMKTLSGFHFDELSKKVFFLLLKKNFLKKSSKNMILSNLNLFGTKPIHLEISYKIFTAIFLYSPQRVYYPFALDFDLLKRIQP